MNTRPNPPATEIEPIHMINLNEDSVFNVLYDKYWNPLINFAGQYVSDKDACQEIVQELFITMHSKKDTITINTSLSSYLYGSLRNRIINYIRNESVYRRHVAGASLYDISAQTYNNVEQFMNFIELKKEISECLSTMPGRYKEVYMMYMQNQYNLGKIATILKRPLATVEKQFRKAAAHLRKHLQDQKWRS